jgi:hypothetical protein
MVENKKKQLTKIWNPKSMNPALLSPTRTEQREGHGTVEVPSRVVSDGISHCLELSDITAVKHNKNGNIMSKTNEDRIG